ncbi:MAG: translation initiation factor [Actinomycetota bacterium]
MRLDNLFGGILDALTGGDRSRRDQQPYEDDVTPASRDPFGDPGDVRSSREDPYGDPADIQVRSSSEDPYGDPADEMEGERVLPSSRDPYGDPADRY